MQNHDRPRLLINGKTAEETPGRIIRCHRPVDPAFVIACIEAVAIGIVAICIAWIVGG